MYHIQNVCHASWEHLKRVNHFKMLYSSSKKTCSQASWRTFPTSDVICSILLKRFDSIFTPLETIQNVNCFRSCNNILFLQCVLLVTEKNKMNKIKEITAALTGFLNHFVELFLPLLEIGQSGFFVGCQSQNQLFSEMSDRL